MNMTSVALLVLLTFISVTEVNFGGSSSNNPLHMTLIRHHPPFFRKESPVRIDVTVTASEVENLRAIGIEERLPEGWTFVALEGSEGQGPSIYPNPGAVPPFEFVWITPPNLPFTFSYSVLPPDYEIGTQQFFGTIEYRLDGPACHSPTTITEIQLEPSEKPSILLQGENPLELEQYSVWEEPGYVALDADQRDISSHVRIESDVNTDIPGVYFIKYSVTSPINNLSSTATRTVRVYPSDNDKNEPSSKQKQTQSEEIIHGYSSRLQSTNIITVDRLVPRGQHATSEERIHNDAERKAMNQQASRTTSGESTDITTSLHITNNEMAESSKDPTVNEATTHWHEETLDSDSKTPPPLSSQTTNDNAENLIKNQFWQRYIFAIFFGLTLLISAFTGIILKSKKRRVMKVKPYPQDKNKSK